MNMLHYFAGKRTSLFLLWTALVLVVELSLMVHVESKSELCNDNPPATHTVYVGEGKIGSGTAAANYAGTAVYYVQEAQTPQIVSFTVDGYTVATEISGTFLPPISLLCRTNVPVANGGLIAASVNPTSSATTLYKLTSTSAVVMTTMNSKATSMSPFPAHGRFVVTQNTHVVTVTDANVNHLLHVFGVRGQSGSADGSTGTGKFNDPSGSRVSRDGGTIFVCDRNGLRKVDIFSGVITTTVSKSSTLFEMFSLASIGPNEQYFMAGNPEKLVFVDTVSATTKTFFSDSTDKSNFLLYATANDAVRLFSRRNISDAKTNRNFPIVEFQLCTPPTTAINTDPVFTTSEATWPSDEPSSTDHSTPQPTEVPSSTNSAIGTPAPTQGASTTITDTNDGLSLQLTIVVAIIVVVFVAAAGIIVYCYFKSKFAVEAERADAARRQRAYTTVKDDDNRDHDVLDQYGRATTYAVDVGGNVHDARYVGDVEMSLPHPPTGDSSIVPPKPGSSSPTTSPHQTIGRSTLEAALKNAPKSHLPQQLSHSDQTPLGRSTGGSGVWGSCNSLGSTIDRQDKSREPSRDKDLVGHGNMSDMEDEEDTSYTPGQTPNSTHVDDRTADIKQLLNNYEYTKVKLLGRGAFGSVYSCVLNNGHVVAMKEMCLPVDDGMSNDTNYIRSLQQEVDLVSHVSHPNVIRYYGSKVIQKEHKILLFMEIAAGGSLATLARNAERALPENVARVYIIQIVKALTYLHKKGVVHRDLKCDNVLLTNDGKCKLGDFGTSRAMNQTTQGRTKAANTVIGTPLFMAPEMIDPTLGTSNDQSSKTSGVREVENGGGVDGYTTKADVWSLGILVLELLNRGATPWPDFPNHAVAMMYIGSPKGQPPIPEHLSPELRDFLSRCLERDPRKRASANELQNHTWIVRGGGSIDASLTRSDRSVAESVKLRSSSRDPSTSAKEQWS